MKPVKVERQDSVIDFNWVRNSPDPRISYDNFTATWTTTFIPECTANYTFEVEVDDNVTVLVNDKVIIDYNPKKGEESQSNAEEASNWRSTKGSIKLKKNHEYVVKVRYEEKDVNAMMRLLVSDNDKPKSGFSTPAGVDAVYECMQPYVCYTTKDDVLYAIAIEYPQDSLVLEIPKPTDGTVVAMLGCDKVLPWSYEDGKLIIDTTPLKYNDLQSTAAWVFKISRDR